MEDVPTVTVLLLGDSDCGKSTFLAKLSQGSHSLSKPTSASALPPLRDEDQPFVYEIRMYNRPYRFEIYDTACPTTFTLLHPDFIILCYDIGNRISLQNMQNVWWRKMIEWFMSSGDGRSGRGDGEEIPVMVLGLKRDLRVEGPGVIYPQEGHRIAAELRCDLYAECSAITGELMGEVFEDVARRAAKTTTSKGGLSDGAMCGVM